MRHVGAVFYGLTFLYAMPNVLMPIDGNTSIFDYVGRGWLEGYWPYQSSVDHKPPGLYLVYALAALAFGHQACGIRLLELVAVLAMGNLLGRVFPRSDQPARDLGGIAAMLVAAFYYTVFDYFSTGEAEIWEALFLVAAWCAARTGARSDTRSLCVGTLGGTAFMFKFSAAIPFAGIAAILLWRLRREGSRRLARHASIVIVGFVSIIATLCLPFVLTGRGPEMWEVTVSFNAFYATLNRFPEQSAPGWFWQEHALASTTILLVAMCIAVVRVLWTRRYLKLCLATEVVLLGVLSILSVVAQRKYLHYHWGVASPFVAAGILWAILVISEGDAWVTSVTLICVTCTFLLTPKPGALASVPMQPYKEQVSAAWHYARGSMSREQYIARYRSTYYSYGTIERFGTMVNRNKRSKDTLCTLRTFAPPIYTLTGLRCPSRFFADHVLWYITGEPQRAGALKNWLTEHETALSSHPPTFLLVPTGYKRMRWGQLYRVLATEARLMLLMRSD
jgi:hypothetical protein